MLVVVIEEDGIFRELKVFSDLSEARAFAEERVQSGDDAKVYAVSANNAHAAKAAIEMGEGTLIAAPSRQLSDAEREDRDKRYWRQQFREL